MGHRVSRGKELRSTHPHILLPPSLRKGVKDNPPTSPSPPPTPPHLWCMAAEVQLQLGSLLGGGEASEPQLGQPLQLLASGCGLGLRGEEWWRFRRCILRERGVRGTERREGDSAITAQLEQRLGPMRGRRGATGGRDSGRGTLLEGKGHNHSSLRTQL